MVIDSMDYNPIDVSDCQLVVSGGMTERYATECYSTREAAAAAAKAAKETNNG